MRYFPLLSLFIWVSVFAQTSDEVHFSGVIKSKETGEVIPRASIGILGTQHGTIANKDGQFTITVVKNRAIKLRIRAIGYKPDTIDVTSGTLEVTSILLSTEAVIGKEIIVSSDASRIEARRIIREVIRRKKEWQSKLNDYQCTAYSRWNLKTLSSKDTTIQSVLESTADCYWKKEKGFSEIITSRRQTANFPPELNSFSVGDIVNFYDNRLEFNDLSLVGPVADDAFGSYDYDLKGTGLLNGASVYQISVEPDLLTEGFQGILWIDQTDYTIAYLDLSPSEAVKIGPVKDVHLQQTFELFENNFYLPIDLRTTIAIKLQLPFVPVIKFELLSVLQNYSVNKGVEDSLFGIKRHRVAPMADSIDTAKFVANRAIPLAADEEKAYHRIDSTVAIAKKDSSGGVDLLSFLQYIDIPSYNHVEGWRFGVSHSFTPVQSFPFSFNGGIAYGLNDKLWKYEVGLKQGILWTTITDRRLVGDFNGGFSGKVVKEPVVLLALEAKYFDDLTARGDAYGRVFNTITSLIYNKDYQEFYHEKGFSTALNLTPGYGFDASVSYKNSRIWDADSQHIIQPEATLVIGNPNIHRKLSMFDVSVSHQITFGGITLHSSGICQISSSQIGSDYTFSTLKLELTAGKRFGGLGVTELTGRYYTLLGPEDPAPSVGPLPSWDYFFFETRSGFFSHEGYFRGLSPFEFQGDRLWSLNLEHNFYDLPTRLLGIHFLDFLDLHWLLHGGIGEIEHGGVLPLGSSITNGKPYSEVGFGIGNIYNILQLEGTWRLTHKTSNNFYPTLEIKFSF
jgi:hypothetical protein